MGAAEQRYREAEQRLWDHVGVDPAERRLALDRHRVQVRVQELGEGPPVLFVHGTTNAGTSWAPLVARLGDSRSILLDRPGCGLSDPLPEPLDVDGFPAFAESLLVDVLDALELPSARIVATSYGAYLALRTAAAHPARVERLLLLGWSLGGSLPHVPALMRVASLPGVGRLVAAVPVAERTVRSMLGQIGLEDALAADRVPAEFVAWFTALLNHTRTMGNELAQGPRIISMAGMDPRVLLPDDVLASISTPTHLLWGERDPFGGPDEARRLAARIPGASLEVMPGGHAVWLDDPDHVADVARRFLAPTPG